MALGDSKHATVKFFKVHSLGKNEQESTNTFRDTQISLNTVYHEPRKASVTKSTGFVQPF